MKKCPKCGTANDVRENHCQNCGESLADKTTPPIESAKKGTGLIIGSAAFLVVAVIAAVVLLTAGNRGGGVESTSTQSYSTAEYIEAGGGTQPNAEPVDGETTTEQWWVTPTVEAPAEPVAAAAATVATAAPAATTAAAPPTTVPPSSSAATTRITTDMQVQAKFKSSGYSIIVGYTNDFISNELTYTPSTAIMWLTWSSSDPAVIKIDADTGRIEALAVGTATIAVMYHEKEIAHAPITVKPAQTTTTTAAASSSNAMRY
ncbi:MAG: zinc ribbon domain-containing protein [Oscillospiraceae bacterium]|nr:zinc ribbon domain-containing protein [Oscillospiraceae bacterium]